MLPTENLAIILGIASALSWGAGDFAGGYAAKRTSAYTVVLVTQILGILIFPILAFVFSESLPPLNNLMWGALAGFFGAAGLIALYMGMAKGKISIVATLAAVIAVIIPVIYSALNEGIPSIFKITGFIFAFIGIGSIVRMNVGPNLKAKDLEYSLIAGILFGLFFISIDNFSATAIYWPLTVSRISAFIMLTGFIMLTKTANKPTSDVILVVILAGLFNTGGAALFALASEAGRLDIATILSSLSPAVTVLLACILLKEQLALRQWIGVIAALFAIILISIDNGRKVRCVPLYFQMRVSTEPKNLNVELAHNPPILFFRLLHLIQIMCTSNNRRCSFCMKSAKLSVTHSFIIKSSLYFM